MEVKIMSGEKPHWSNMVRATLGTVDLQYVLSKIQLGGYQSQLKIINYFVSKYYSKPAY